MSELAQGWAARLRAMTPARVALGQTGVSQRTRELLEFQRAHAMARDAVHARLDGSALAAELEAATGAAVVRVKSQAKERTTYLQRPDLGRALDAESSTELAALRDAEGFELALVVADGLSALAVERNAATVIRELMQRLEGWRMAPACVVEQGRVAIGDAIGEALGARLCVVLIGERPGLSSPDSLGAYITWEPRVGRTDAERNCISNIRGEGLSPVIAAAQLSSYLTDARRKRLTGVALRLESAQLSKG